MFGIYNFYFLLLFDIYLSLVQVFFSFKVVSKSSQTSNIAFVEVKLVLFFVPYRYSVVTDTIQPLIGGVLVYCYMKC